MPEHAAWAGLPGRRYPCMAFSREGLGARPSNVESIKRVQARLGARVTWREVDVTAEWDVLSVDIWHDAPRFIS